MNTALMTNLSSERIQIRKLVDIVVVMSSIATAPGLLVSWYPISVVLSSLVQSPSKNTWITAFLFASVLYLGWWLYWTYGLELSSRNHFGKITWLASGLVNGGAAYWLIFYLLPQFGYQSICFYLCGFWVLWLLVMTVLSIWVWTLRVRESAHLFEGKLP
jgi:hypothetical protein